MIVTNPLACLSFKQIAHRQLSFLGLLQPLKRKRPVSRLRQDSKGADGNVVNATDH